MLAYCAIFLISVHSYPTTYLTLTLTPQNAHVALRMCTLNERLNIAPSPHRRCRGTVLYGLMHVMCLLLNSNKTAKNKHDENTCI